MDNEFPFIGSSRSDAKSLVVQVLSKEWPLTSKQISSSISRDFQKKITYAGVHKAVAQLASESVVVRHAAGYELNTAWIKSVREFGDQLEQSYIDRKDSRITEFRPPSWFSIATRSFSLFKNFFLNNRLRFSSESIYLFDHRVNIIPSDVFVNMNRLCKGRESAVVYEACRQSGYNWVKLVLERGFFKTEEDVAIHGAEVMSVAGWSHYSIEQYDVERRRVTLSMSGCPVAEEYVKQFGKSKRPICDVPRGLYAGGYSLLLKEPSLECVETQCKAMGDNKCIFELRTRAAFPKSRETERQIGKRRVRKTKQEATQWMN